MTPGSPRWASLRPQKGGLAAVLKPLTLLREAKKTVWNNEPREDPSAFLQIPAREPLGSEPCLGGCSGEVCGCGTHVCFWQALL